MMMRRKEKIEGEDEKDSKKLYHGCGVVEKVLVWLVLYALLFPVRVEVLCL